jgi:hypothetical protein
MPAPGKQLCRPHLTQQLSVVEPLSSYVRSINRRIKVGKGESLSQEQSKQKGLGARLKCEALSSNSSTTTNKKINKYKLKIQ